MIEALQTAGTIIGFIRDWWPWLAGGTVFFALGGFVLTTSVGAPILGFLLGTKVGRWLTFGMLVTASIAAALATSFSMGYGRGEMAERARNLRVRSQVIRANVKDKGGWMGGIPARSRAAEAKAKPTFWGRKK